MRAQLSRFRTCADSSVAFSAGARPQPQQITNLDVFKHLLAEEIPDSAKLQWTGWTLLLLTHHLACLKC